MKHFKFPADAKIFYTSDPHLGHSSVCKGLSKWTSGNLRDFNTIEEHDDAIIDNINRFVGENDILFILGDLTLGNSERVIYYRMRIKCKNVHFIFGNHDRDIRENKKDCRKYFSSVQPKLEITVGEQKITLDHYACRTWNQSHRGAWNLFGHSHDMLSDFGVLLPQNVLKYTTLVNGEEIEVVFPEPRIMLAKTDIMYKVLDVGVDSAIRLLGEPRPFSHQEVKDYMETRFSQGHKI